VNGRAPALPSSKGLTRFPGQTSYEISRHVAMFNRKAQSFRLRQVYPASHGGLGG
jgi:hypothetical protein